MEKKVSEGIISALKEKGITTTTNKGGELRPLFNEDALLRKGEVVWIVPYQNNLWIPKTVQGNDTYAYPAIKYPSVEAYEKDEENRKKGKFTKESFNYEYYPNSTAKTAVLGTIDGDNFVPGERVGKYTGTFYDKYIEVRDKTDDPDTIMENIAGEKGIAFVVSATDKKDMWVQGWETFQGKRQPSNSKAPAKKGFNIYTLDVL